MIDRTAPALALADNGEDSEQQSGHDARETVRAARRISASTLTRGRTRTRTRTRGKQRNRRNAVRRLAATAMLLALALQFEFELSTTATRRLSRSTVRAFGTASISRSSSRSISRSFLERGTVTPRIQHLAAGGWSGITNHAGVLGMSSDNGSGSGSDSEGGKRRAPRADGHAAGAANANANANRLVRDAVESVLDTALEASATDTATDAAAASDSAADTQALPASVSRLLQSTLRRAYSTTSTRAAAGEDLDTNVDRDNDNGIVVNNGGNNNDDTTAANTGNREKTGAVGADANGSGNGLVRDVVESVLDTALEASAADAGGGGASSSSAGSRVVSRLLESTLRRAYSTTSIRTSAGTETPPLSGIKKVSAEEDAVASDPVAPSASASASASRKPRFQRAIAYKDHPALNNVALAHALWASVVKPGVDTVIDATCGNGNDSIVLAELLFGRGCDGDGSPQAVPQEREREQNQTREHEQPRPVAPRPELVCLDVQELACERTAEALRGVLPSSVPVLAGDDSTVPFPSPFPSPHPGGRALVLNASHERLPELRDDSSVGLIVYNLGWLPGSGGGNDNDNNNDNDGKACVTTLDTTLSSLVDAVGLLRVGGMLSVITYPQTGPAEAAAVRLLVEALALRSSRTRTWEGALEEYASGASDGSGGVGEEEEDRRPEEGPSADAIAKAEKRAIAAKVRAAMETVVARGPRTWRVSEHDRLGMDRPPILYTATRIK